VEVKTSIPFVLVLIMLAGCAPRVRFIQTDASYQPYPRAKSAEIVFRKDRINRPHQVIGIIIAELGRQARRPELNALIVCEARDVGADGVMLVEYDVERDAYIQRHHDVVMDGPWRTHIITTRPQVEVKKTATAIAVVFK
jgi:hypothetical protein